MLQMYHKIVNINIKLGAGKYLPYVYVKGVLCSVINIHKFYSLLWTLLHLKFLDTVFVFRLWIIRYYC